MEFLKWVLLGGLIIWLIGRTKQGGASVPNAPNTGHVTGGPSAGDSFNCTTGTIRVGTPQLNCGLCFSLSPHCCHFTMGAAPVQGPGSAVAPIRPAPRPLPPVRVPNIYVMKPTAPAPAPSPNLVRVGGLFGITTFQPTAPVVLHCGSLVSTVRL